MSPHGSEFIVATGHKQVVGCDSDNKDNTSTLIVFCHAGGLCKELWLPVWRRLLPHLPPTCRLLALDAPGHGDAALPGGGQQGRDWPTWYHAALLRALQLHCSADAPPRLFGVGHSFGSVPLMQAAWAQGNAASACAPSTYMPALQQLPVPLQHLLVVEPVLMPGDPGPHPHAENALWAHARARTDTWPSTQAAQTYFGSRKPLQRWHTEALAMYASVLTRGVHGGKGGVTLKCPRAFEADCYRGYHQLWDAMADEGVSGGGAMGCGGTVLVAERDDVFGGAGDVKWVVQGGHVGMFEGVVDRWKVVQGGAVVSGARCERVGGCGHFAVQEQPGVIAGHVLGMLQG